MPQTPHAKVAPLKQLILVSFSKINLGVIFEKISIDSPVSTRSAKVAGALQEVRLLISRLAASPLRERDIARAHTNATNSCEEATPLPPPSPTSVRAISLRQQLDLKQIEGSLLNTSTSTARNKLLPQAHHISPPL